MNDIDRIKKLTAELLQYCHEYYDLDCPTISDTIYDKKFDELKSLEDETGFWLSNSPTRKVQGETLPYLTKVKHSVPMLSAEKSTDIEDVKKFIGNHTVVASFKLDGSTLVVKYKNGHFYQALSRGSGTDGEDITHTARMIKNLPMEIPYKGYLEVRGESLIPWKYYNEMNTDGSLGHPRNVASGGLRQLDANEAIKRNIYFYAFTLVNYKDVNIKFKTYSLDFLYENGFDVVRWIMCRPTEIEKIPELLDIFLNREKYKNPTDGWCFEYNDLAYGDSLGSTGHHDRRLFALKPSVDEHPTKLQYIDWTIGKTGVLTPTAVFDSVDIDNTEVSRASLHNISIMNQLGLTNHCTVNVIKANMIIPQIVSCEDDGDGEIAIPSVCPVCGGATKIQRDNASDVLVCTNPNCTGKKLGQFVHFASKKAMDIQGLSEATLETLISADFIRNYYDIYHLKCNRNKLILLNGYGEKSIDKLLKSIEDSRNVALDRFICALGIDTIGSTASKTISNKFNGDFTKFIYACAHKNYKWEELDDFGTVMSNNIKQYMEEHIEEVIELAKEMNFVVPEKKVVAENPFSGKNVAVTGKLFNFTRDSINEKLISLGAKPVSSISKKTDYLICNEASTSSKYRKAQELGVEVISEVAFLKMIGE